jgi:hypothetical protein
MPSKRCVHIAERVNTAPGSSLLPWPPWSQCRCGRKSAGSSRLALVSLSLFIGAHRTSTGLLARLHRWIVSSERRSLGATIDPNRGALRQSSPSRILRKNRLQLGQILGCYARSALHTIRLRGDLRHSIDHQVHAGRRSAVGHRKVRFQHPYPRIVYRDVCHHSALVYFSLQCRRFDQSDALRLRLTARKDQERFIQTSFGAIQFNRFLNGRFVKSRPFLNLLILQPSKPGARIDAPQVYVAMTVVNVPCPLATDIATTEASG